MRIMTYKNFQKYKFDKWSCFNYNTTKLSLLAFSPFLRAEIKIWEINANIQF